MKKGIGYLKCTAVLALAAILVALAVWITSIYRSSAANYLQTTNKCLTQATDEELRMRMFSFGGKFEASFKPHPDSVYITKIIEVDDGRIFHIRIRKDDPTAIAKLRQFNFHLADYPLNIADVDNAFRQYMAENSLPVKASYIEYLDLEKNVLIAGNAPEGKLSGYMASNVDTLDILKTIGVRAHAKVPFLVLLRPVMMEFIAAVALMLIAVACIVKLIIDIRKLVRKGFRFLRFVSLKAEHSLTEVTEQIDGIAGKLHDKGMEEEAAELEKAKEGAVITPGYFERLRCISDNEERKIVFNRTAFHLKTLLDELKEKYENIIYKDVGVYLVADDTIYLYTDRYYMKRVFEELLDNSVKHTGSPVRIQIVAARQGQQIVMVVCDCGGGIDQSDLDNIYIVNHDIARLFNEEIKRETKAGLGLSFVVSFVRALGGSVKINSEDNIAAARIVFDLSVNDLQQIAEQKNKELAGKPPGKTINLSGRK